MGISNSLTGTPWHVDRFTRDEDDPKRHRSRCIYYDKTHTVNFRCEKRGKCIGSAHCEFYYEKRHSLPEEKPKTKQFTKSKQQTKTSTGKAPNKSAETTFQQRLFLSRYPKGCRVHHRQYGKGVVKGFVDKERVRIVFESGRDTEFNIELCLKKGILLRLS